MPIRRECPSPHHLLIISTVEPHRRGDNKDGVTIALIVKEGEPLGEMKVAIVGVQIDNIRVIYKVKLIDLT